MDGQARRQTSKSPETELAYCFSELQELVVEVVWNNTIKKNTKRRRQKDSSRNWPLICHKTGHSNNKEGTGKGERCAA